MKIFQLMKMTSEAQAEEDWLAAGKHWFQMAQLSTDMKHGESAQIAYETAVSFFLKGDHKSDAISALRSEAGTTGRDKETTAAIYLRIAELHQDPEKKLDACMVASHWALDPFPAILSALELVITHGFYREAINLLLHHMNNSSLNEEDRRSCAVAVCLCYLLATEDKKEASKEATQFVNRLSVENMASEKESLPPIIQTYAANYAPAMEKVIDTKRWIGKLAPFQPRLLGQLEKRMSTEPSLEFLHQQRRKNAISHIHLKANILANSGLAHIYLGEIFVDASIIKELVDRYQIVRLGRPFYSLFLATGSSPLQKKRDEIAGALIRRKAAMLIEDGLCQISLGDLHVTDEIKKELGENYVFTQSGSETILSLKDLMVM